MGKRNYPIGKWGRRASPSFVTKGEGKWKKKGWVRKKKGGEEGLDFSRRLFKNDQKEKKNQGNAAHFWEEKGGRKEGEKKEKNFCSAQTNTLEGRRKGGEGGGDGESFHAQRKGRKRGEKRRGGRVPFEIPKQQRTIVSRKKGGENSKTNKGGKKGKDEIGSFIISGPIIKREERREKKRGGGGVKGKTTPCMRVRRGEEKKRK